MLCISDNRHLDFLSGCLDLFDGKTFVAFRHKGLFVYFACKKT